MSEIQTALTDDAATPTQDSAYEPFSYDGYQIVRREMFARTNEPAVVIRKKSITFNTACINGLEDAVYIEILVNPEKRSIAIRQSDKNKKEAQRWLLDRIWQGRPWRIKESLSERTQKAVMSGNNTAISSGSGA